jgi:hypothetical protein
MKEGPGKARGRVPFGEPGLREPCLVWDEGAALRVSAPGGRPDRCARAHRCQCQRRRGARGSSGSASSWSPLLSSRNDAAENPFLTTPSARGDAGHHGGHHAVAPGGLEADVTASRSVGPDTLREIQKENKIPVCHEKLAPISEKDWARRVPVPGATEKRIMRSESRGSEHRGQLSPRPWRRGFFLGAVTAGSLGLA